MENRLETILKEKGLKKGWLAKKLNVTNQTITNWSKGYNYPDLQTLKKLSVILEVGIGDIFFVENNNINIDINNKNKININIYDNKKEQSET